MRKSREAAAATRRQIVTAAAADFRRRGIEGTGLAEVMKSAGLTHGGFYKHFESKGQLVTEAAAEAVASILEAMAATTAAGGPKAGAALYLSARHRDNPAGGCPLAAIGAELARADEATRAVATAGFLELVTLMGGTGSQTEGEARRRALLAVATMIGALTMARVVNDPALSAEILGAVERQLTGD